MKTKTTKSEIILDKKLIMFNCLYPYSTNLGELITDLEEAGLDWKKWGVFPDYRFFKIRLIEDSDGCRIVVKFDDTINMNSISIEKEKQNIIITFKENKDTDYNLYRIPNFEELVGGLKCEVLIGDEWTEKTLYEYSSKSNNENTYTDLKPLIDSKQIRIKINENTI